MQYLAHSGGTDADGGHHCWTDCEKYGYEYGEYHYHDKDSDISPFFFLSLIALGVYLIWNKKK